MVGRDLLDRVGTAHANEGIRVGHASEERWKEAAIIHHEIDDSSDATNGTSIAALEVLHE
jgi:hypothetical protein